MKRFDSKLTVFSNVIMWVLPLILVVPNIALCFTEISYSALDCAINVLLPFGVYLLLSASGRAVGRTVLFFIPVMILCAFQIVLLFLYGESIIAIDMFLNVVTTSVGEATELLTGLLPAILVVCLSYLPVIIAGIFLCLKNGRTDAANRKYAVIAGGAITLVGFILLIVASCSAGYRPTRKLFPVNVISNMFSAANRTVETAEYHNNADGFTFDARSLRPSDEPELYILVIGETSRAGNWQINGYERDTNPHLSHRKGIVSLSKVLSESNTTHKSVPLMLSHLSSESFGDSIYCSKGIMEAFDEAGYETAWISNQKRNHSLIDFFGEQAEECKFISDDGQAHYDLELCPMLEEFISQPGAPKRFVALHTYGSHFNYSDRYPDECRHYTPDTEAEAMPEYRHILMNAYDNTIRYTDLMLDSIISIADRSGVPAAVVYVADHGEDIFDDSRNRFLHASPTPTGRQLHVPMLVWMSESYRNAHPEKFEALVANSGKNVSSSRSIFHTLLSLAAVKSRVEDASSAITEKSYVEPTRVYLNDYDEAVPLSASGLRKTDMEYLSQARIN